LSVEGTLLTSCSCRIEPDCDIGNTEMCYVALDYCCATEESEIRARTDAQAASANTALMKRESTLTVEKMLSCCAQRWRIVLVASVTIGLNCEFNMRMNIS
jgi:hypothetical protein